MKKFDWSHFINIVVISSLVVMMWVFFIVLIIKIF